MWPFSCPSIRSGDHSIFLASRIYLSLRVSVIKFYPEITDARHVDRDKAEFRRLSRDHYWFRSSFTGACIVQGRCRPSGLRHRCHASNWEIIAANDQLACCCAIRVLPVHSPQSTEGNRSPSWEDLLGLVRGSAAASIISINGQSTHAPPL